MLYVALTALGTLALTVTAFAGLLRSTQRQHAREREALLARLMHLAGRTWEPPPARVEAEPDGDADRFLVSPTPDDF